VLRPHRGYVILGANALGLALGECLRDGGHEVVFVDTNGTATGNAEKAGFNEEQGEAAREWLRGTGWTPAPPEVGADQAEEGASPRQPGADRAEPPS
jgi:hypothetical protein